MHVVHGEFPRMANGSVTGVARLDFCRRCQTHTRNIPSPFMERTSGKTGCRSLHPRCTAWHICIDQKRHKDASIGCYNVCSCCSEQSR